MLQAFIYKQFFNIAGAKFLWWTWHDTDAPVRDRLFGAPVGSSCWVFTFSGKAFVTIKNLSAHYGKYKNGTILICQQFQTILNFSASFQWLLHATLPTEVRHGKTKEPTFGRMLYCIVINGLLCTPIMMIQMSFFQLVSGDLQGKFLLF